MPSAEPWVFIVATALIGVAAVVVLVRILRAARDDSARDSARSNKD